MTANPHWRRELALRLRTLFWMKAVGTAGGMALFLWAYFWVLRHPLGPVTVMPELWLDRAIGVQPWSFPLYASLWVYISLGTTFARDLRELLSFGAASLGMGLVGLVAFLLVPTQVPTSSVDWSAYPWLSFLKSVDAPGNACPSLHVAFCVFTWAVLRGQLRAVGAPRALETTSTLWCAGIVFSAVATGQHVTLDAIAGAALGGVAALAYVRGVWPAAAMGREAGEGLR
ncbi:MAG TPA: phosphatase PAP2 family protein [Burkholderiales bacterium]|nr:phosphatase PAP2 family protein [Burkholderiales bacterium]